MAPPPNGLALPPVPCPSTIEPEALRRGNMSSLGFTSKEQRNLGLLVHLMTSNPKILYAPAGSEVDRVILKVRGSRTLDRQSGRRSLQAWDPWAEGVGRTDMGGVLGCSFGYTGSAGGGPGGRFSFRELQGLLWEGTGESVPAGSPGWVWPVQGSAGGGRVCPETFQSVPWAGSWVVCVLGERSCLEQAEARAGHWPGRGGPVDEANSGCRGGSLE